MKQPTTLAYDIIRKNKWLTELANYIIVHYLEEEKAGL